MFAVKMSSLRCMNIRIKKVINKDEVQLSLVG